MSTRSRSSPPSSRSTATSWLAVAAYPEESLLRLSVDPVLAGASPLERLGTAVDNRARYLAALENASALLRREAGSGRSELTAVAAGLREALRPLTAVPDRVRALFARFGLDVAGKSLGAIALETLEACSPLAGAGAALAGGRRVQGESRGAPGRGLSSAPARQVVGELEALLAAIDISFVRTELEAVHAEVVAEVEQFRPSTLLGELVTSAEETLAVVAAFDPLGAVTAVIEEMKAAIEDVVDNFRPTDLFGPILETYDEILAAASGLDVRNLLAPVLEALAEIELQLEEGLTETAAALTQLQGACHSQPPDPEHRRDARARAARRRRRGARAQGRRDDLRRRPAGALAPVAVRGPERRVLALAQAAKAMFEGGSKVDTPPSLRVGQGLGRFAVLGSAGFELAGVRGRLRAGRRVGCRRRAAGHARPEPQPRRCADDAVRRPRR